MTHSPEQELQAAFRDPTSPYHIPEGSQGPASPDERPSILSAAEEGRVYFENRGFDSASFWEQPIAWGDHDAFQYEIIPIVLLNDSPSHLLPRHVNNVRYRAYLPCLAYISWLTFKHLQCASSNLAAYAGYLPLARSLVGPPKPMRSSERGVFPSFSSQSKSTSAGPCNIPIQSASVSRVVRL